MRLARIAYLRLRTLVARARVEQELDEELRYHLDREIEELVARGVPRGEAERRVRRQLAGVEQRKEECRDMRGLHPIDPLAGDVRFALRQLRKNRGFTAAAIFLLALGLCASVAIFAFVDAALVKPLPYRDPARLVAVYETVPLFPRSNLSYLDYLDWKQQNTVFSDFDIYNRTGFIMTTPAGAEPVRGTRVSAGFFRTLGVTPALGRDFRPGEDQPGAPRTVILSHGSWQTRFGGRADAIGRVLTIDGEPATIIGVLPASFHFVPGDPAEFWASLQPTRGCEKRRGCHNMYGVARLKDGVTPEAALANVRAIAKALEQQYPESNRDQGAAIATLTDAITGDVRPLLLMLLAGAGLLLLIACVNTASLLLVRSESRQREMAVRRALGASTSRLVSQFATESLVLVAAGSALGLFAAHGLMQLLVGFIPPEMLANLAYLRDLGLNLRVTVFAGAIAVAATLLFAMIPSLRLAASPSSREALADGSRGSAGRAWRRLGANLVVAELAIAMVLLVGAGLLGQSLYRLLRVDIGIRPEGVATLQVGAPDGEYGTPERLVALQREILARVKQLPGVTAAGVTSSIPVSGNGNTTWVRIAGRAWEAGEKLEVPFREITPEYFAAVGATLLRGRTFTETDDASRPQVVVINETFARQHFANEDPIGQRLTYMSTPPPPPLEIVGVVNDIKEGPIDVATPAVMYVPSYQNPSSYFGLVVRTGASPEALLPSLASTIRSINRGIVTMAPLTMVDRIHDSRSNYLRRSAAWLVGGFAAVALLLGVVGLYGVVAYSVSQRRREVGVRMALGAQPGAVYRLVMMEAGRLTTMGVAIGLVGAIAAGIMMRGLLFGVAGWDVPTLLAVTVLLGLAALAASFVPARRAASVNPVEALRSE